MLKKLYCLIKEGKILKKEMFINKNIDELLDLRDESIFDDEWIKVYNYLELSNVEISNIDLINKIREEVFLKTYDLSKSSEIAECISDDFEIIVKGFSINYDDDWLNSLALCYVEDVFPCGNLTKTNLNLNEIIDKFLLKF